MPAPNHQPQEIVLAGQRLPLAVSDRTPAFESEFVPSDPADLLPKRWHLPFGYYGMGASLPTFPGGYDYGLGTDPGEQWDELAPGLLHTKLGLALDSQVVTLDVATPGSEDSGFTELGTWSNDNTIGTTAWTNPGNAQTSNDSRATITLAASATSNYLKGLNSGSAFSIPTDATVLGIVVEMEYQAQALAATFNLRLVLGGVVQTGTTQSLTTTGAADVVRTVGGATYLWGQPSITAAQVNATDFGATLHVVNGGSPQNIAVDRIRVRVYYGSTSKLLYAGGGAVLTKVRWALSASPTFTTVETKTFTHGTNGTPVITDAIFLKGGDAAGDGFGIVVFGATASLQQIDTLRAYDDDDYTLADGVTPSQAAYGEKLATALGVENTEALVWKSVGQSGENGGVFCRVHAATAIATTKNYTILTSWTPRSDTGVPYQVGQYDTGITMLTRWGRSLLPGKPEGTFSFDQNAAAFEAFITAAFQHPDNGKNTQAFGTGVLIPTAYDLAEYPAEGDAYIGISQLPSNLSPIQGRPTALAHYGPDLFVNYYDGTDSYIVRLRRSAPGDPVPHPFVIHGLHKVASYQITVMLVGSDSAGNTALFYACPSETADKHDIAYLTLDPPAIRKYADAGTWFATRLGDPAKFQIWERLLLYGINCSSTAKWTAAVSWDEAAFASYSSTEVTTTGRVELRPTTVGTNDRGYIGQLRLTCSNSTSTNKPRLRALTTTEEGAGGVIVEGQAQADAVEVLRYRVNLTINQEHGRGAKYFTTPRERYNTLRALQGTVVDIIDVDHFGDSTARKVRVQRVSYARARKDAERPAERVVTIEVRRLIGDTA